MSTRSTAAGSTEFALQLAEDRDHSSSSTSNNIQLILMHVWLDRQKRSGELTAVEKRCKEACLEWFTHCSPEEIESVSKLYFTEEWDLSIVASLCTVLVNKE